MYSDKKITKEDTWKPADLRRHLREEGHGDDYDRRRDETGRKHRGGESTERHRRDPERESRRERGEHGERESTRDRRGEEEKDRYIDRRKEGSRDRRGDKERDRREDREKRRERERLEDANKYSYDSRENRDRRRDKEEKHERERDKERDRDKEKNRDRDGQRHSEEYRNKRREDRDKERRREERDREHRTERERRRHEESGEGERHRVEKPDRERRDQHRERDRYKDEYEVTRNDKERRERHEDRKHSELKEERASKEEHRKHKEDRERRHRERGYHDEKRMRDSDSRGHQALKGLDEEVRHQLAEGDKHKERRHRQDEDPERNHRDRTSSNKSSSDKSHETKTMKTHDYEDDFEEMDESANEGEEQEEPDHPEVGEEIEELTPQRKEEIKAIRRAMDEENEQIGTAQSRESMSREEEDRAKWSRGAEKNQRRSSPRGKFIDFVAAKQREVSKKVASKQKKRSTELLRLIDLDFSMTVSLLDLPPVNEYDMYIRNFGTANTKQAYVQCNEDNTDRDIQTEEIEVCEKWTQHPPEHNGACGDPNLSYETRDKTVSEMNFDSQRLTAFLLSASQVMVVLLEEDEAERKSLRKPRTQKDTLSFSDGSLQLNTKLPFLYGRQISLVHFSQVQGHTMMSVHKPTIKPSAVRLDSCTLICIWNIWEPSRPQKILVYESEVQCCCFSPGKAILVFAGTSVGSVVLWDLREHARNHYHLKIGDEEWTFRQPTFSTDAVMVGSGHFSSVTSVEVVPSAIAGRLRPEVLLLASEEESSGLSFQLASLDESGVLNFWVVVELPKTNEAGSQTDLGLRPGGKVKLLHSASLVTAERVSPRDAVKTGPLQTLHLKFLPTDSNHFFIGTNMGLVNHGTSHGLKAPPKFYSFQEVGARPADVSAIHFSPFSQDFFLVGCGDGSIRLHAVSREQPVAEWKNGTAGEPVVSLQWAQTRPTVFCVLDATSNLHIWDLLKNDTEPVVTERVITDRVTAMAVFGDSGQQYSGIALAHESGKIEMQYFTRTFTVPSSAEEEKLERMMTEAF
ncbi:cytoplasmic dynein 2 intermediate chain 1 isoform X2 [Scomber scombrus]|uniref:Cytoplasmic dynein 2 intermediate chain 1 isoform X2 n=1 Tax=Scomber scombrus TaxID=13677 RepID=A0AAV1PEB7_SCOSC